jgi:acyl-CoA hydrolase
MSCFFTMIAVDEKGAPTEVPQLKIETTLEQGLFDAALQRKKSREDYEKAHVATRQKPSKAA